MSETDDTVQPGAVGKPAGKAAPKPPTAPPPPPMRPASQIDGHKTGTPTKPRKPK